MKYSPKFFHDTMPEWKRKKDPLVARVFHRPISFLFSSFFCEIGLTPNQVSFISLIIAFAVCGCFLTGNKVWYLIGAILMNIWSITDSADGNMARSVGGKPALYDRSGRTVRAVQTSKRTSREKYYRVCNSGI